MKMRFVVLAVVVVLGVCSPLAFAWNPAGHMAIASIAYDELSPAQRSAYVAMLREHPRFRQDFLTALPEGLDPEQQARWIFMRAATWPDIARSLSGHDQKTYNHPFWHFIDLPVYLDNEARQKIHPPILQLDYHEISGNTSMNVVAALNKSLDQLRYPNLPLPQKAVALCWVLHLAGDIHQPLHGAILYAAARFREIPVGDRGGNAIPVHETEGLLSDFKSPNLHGLWDSMLGADDSYEATAALAHHLADQYPKPGLGIAIQQQNPATWADESNRIAAASVYTSDIRSAIEAAEPHPHVPLAPIEISSEYLSAARHIAQRRAALAAYRTGAILISAHPD